MSSYNKNYRVNQNIMHAPRKHWLTAATLMILITVLFGQAPVQAMQTAAWSAPQWIPGLDDTTSTQYPVFITDEAGKVHVLHSQWLSNNFTIYYSQWTVGIGWSKPVDLLVPPGGQARVLGAFLDESDMLHLIFWGGLDPNTDIYYMSAPIETAGSATAWSEPMLIGSDAIVPTSGTLINAGDGKMLVIYSGNINGTGLYSVFSEDSGLTWSQPQPFFLTGSDSLWASDIQYHLSTDGRVHAVWALGDVSGNSRQITYAVFTPSDGLWSEPVVLDRAMEYEADTPAIIEYDGQLIVIYHNDFPTTRWMKRSMDGGKTWSAGVHLFDHFGSNGAAALAVDSGGTLHMFFGNRTGSPTVHGLWHSTWQGNNWSVPEAIVSGPQVQEGLNGEEGFDPSYAQALIVQGNLALVVWRHDPSVGPERIWYSYKQLDTPKITTAAVVRTANPTTVAGQAVLNTATPTLHPEFGDDIPVNTGTNAMRSAISIVVMTTLLLIVIIAVLRRKNN